MPLYLWIRTNYDGYQSDYEVWLVRRNELVRVVSNTWIEGKGAKQFLAHSSTNPDGTSDDDESD